MKNQKSIVFVVIVVIVLLALFWTKFGSNRNNSTNPTPTPTVTSTPSAKIATPTPSIRTRVEGYTSFQGHLKFSFPQLMYVLDYMDSSTRGWIVISMNPINDMDPQANGLIINYETPAIEGKGGACEEKDYRSNSMFGQTLRYCETQTSISGGYLMNTKVKTEYAFYITAKGVSEKEVYKDILFNKLSFE